jgi:type II secretory pathway component GspD/PulD (secretin)
MKPSTTILAVFCLTLHFALVSSAEEAAETESQTLQPTAAPPAGGNGSSIELDVAFVEFVATGDDAASQAVDLGDDPLTKALDLVKQGKARSFSRFQLSTLDGQSARVNVGEQAPMVTGRTAFSAGRNPQQANSYSMQSVGSMLQVVPSAADDGSVLLQIEFEKSDIVQQEAKGGEADDLDSERGGSIRLPEPFQPPSVSRHTTKTVLSIPAGKSVIAGSCETYAQTPSGKSFSQSYLIVAAKVTAAPAADAQAAGSQAGKERPAEMRTYRLKNAAAEEAVRLLMTLGFGDARFASDARTNSVIAHGAPARLEAAEALLLKLDEEDRESLRR